MHPAPTLSSSLSNSCAARSSTAVASFYPGNFLATHEISSGLSAHEVFKGARRSTNDTASSRQSTWTETHERLPEFPGSLPPVAHEVRLLSGRCFRSAWGVRSWLSISVHGKRGGTIFVRALFAFGSEVAPPRSCECLRVCVSARMSVEQPSRRLRGADINKLRPEQAREQQLFNLHVQYSGRLPSNMDQGPDCLQPSSDEKNFVRYFSPPAGSSRSTHGAVWAQLRRTLHRGVV